MADAEDESVMPPMRPASRADAQSLRTAVAPDATKLLCGASVSQRHPPRQPRCPRRRMTVDDIRVELASDAPSHVEAKRSLWMGKPAYSSVDTDDVDATEVRTSSGPVRMRRVLG